MYKKCPVCDSLDGVRKYIYGMPNEEPDASKYVLGGCCIYDEMPDYRCVNCSTDFFKNNDIFRNRFIWHFSDFSLKCRNCNKWFTNSDDLKSHECGIGMNPWKDN